MCRTQTRNKEKSWSFLNAIFPSHLISTLCIFHCFEEEHFLSTEKINLTINQDLWTKDQYNHHIGLKYNKALWDANIGFLFRFLRFISVKLADNIKILTDASSWSTRKWTMVYKENWDKVVGKFLLAFSGAFGHSICIIK